MKFINKRSWLGSRINLITAAAILFSTASVSAQNTVVVVPMAGDDLQPLANIVTVAKQNGDFNNPIAALNSITDASATKPYLIVIAPGRYPLAQRLVMKSFVNIAGSGPEVTHLEGAAGIAGSVVTAAAALVEIVDGTRLSNLSVNNTGSNANISGGIAYAANADATTENVNVNVENGDTTFGYIITDNAYASILQNKITLISDVDLSFGVYAVFTDARVRVADSLIDALVPVATGGTDPLCGFVIVLPENDLLTSECSAGF